MIKRFFQFINIVNKFKIHFLFIKMDFKIMHHQDLFGVIFLIHCIEIQVF